MGIRKVLLVEDHADSRRLLRGALERAGFHVVKAGTVAEGMAQVDGQAFALLDLNLPDGGGTAICNKVRVQAPHTRVAFLTAVHDPENTIKSLGSCPNAIFQKPINLAALMNWLRVPVEPSQPLCYLSAKY